MRIGSFRVVRALAVIAVPLLLARCAKAPPAVVPPSPVVSFETKMSWILRLEDRRVIRDPTPPAVIPAPAAVGQPPLIAPPPSSPDLLRLLTDRDARVRRRAALALGRVGLPEAVPGLTTLLADDMEVEVRQMAAFAIGLIGDRSAAQALRQALADASPIVQGRAAEALSLIGDDSSSSAIGEMIAVHLQDGAVARVEPDDLMYPLEPPIEAVRLGLYALARLKAYDPLAHAVLDGRGQPLVRWWPVAFALQRIQDKRAIPALRALAETPTIYTRSFAIRGLGELGDVEAASRLVQLVSSAPSSPAVGVEAIRAVGRIGTPKASPALTELAFSATVAPMLRAEALQALGATGAVEAREGLLDLFQDKNPVVRAAVLGTVAKLDPETFITILSGLEPDPQWTVRSALATVLGTLPADVGTPRLQSMLSDSDLRVIPAVLSSLVKLRAPQIESVLLEFLKHDDAVVRLAAANGLGELKPERAAEALVAAYKFGERDTTYVARAAALAALTKYGTAAAMPTLKDALGDKDWAVRVRAAELMKSLDPSTDAADLIRPAPSHRNREAFDAQQLVAPTVSPHLYIETAKGTIEIELAVIDAPLMADSFMVLARSGFFEGLAFHRVVPNFVVQAGDPRGDGEGGPGYTIRDEINQRPYLRGVVGMALDWRDTGGSQFFITHSPQPHLDTRYTVFGHVVAGIEVVDRLEAGDLIRRIRVWDGTTLEPRDKVP